MKKKREELTDHENQLVTLRDELYEGSWDNMMDDLMDRLGQKPYIYRLNNQIKDDIRDIKYLMTIEIEEVSNILDMEAGK